MATIAPLIVITGPTASGKTSLALELAERWGGEIVCADSRTVYKGMDIGTAKPSSAEQKKVRHWALDVVEPGKRFTAADFQLIANDAIKDIRSRNKVPFLVGGTGLYIDAVVLNFVFGPDVDMNKRDSLESLTTEQLISLHVKQHIDLPVNDNNRRHLVRNIEKNNSPNSRKNAPDPTTFVFAIEIEKEVLRERISLRANEIFAGKIVQETQQLIDNYGRDNEAMTGNIYPLILRMMKGELSEEEAKEQSITKDWQLAKRQLTWLRRHDFVRWLTPSDAKSAIETILQKHRDA
jgi:tRNA dimethylallyltransferase